MLQDRCLELLRLAAARLAPPAIETLLALAKRVAVESSKERPPADSWVKELPPEAQTMLFSPRYIPSPQEASLMFIFAAAFNNSTKKGGGKGAEVLE